jgi:hypothetical protein
LTSFCPGRRATGPIELDGLSRDLEASFVDLDGQLGGGPLDAEDVGVVAEGLDSGSSIAVIAIENLWAVPFVDAAGGEFVDQVWVQWTSWPRPVWSVRSSA